MFLLASPPSLANDIDLNRLESIDPHLRQARLDSVIKDQAMALSGPPSFPVGSLGLYEFEISVTNRMSFLHTLPEGDDATSAWDDVNPTGVANNILWMPGLQFRKGLPFSFEVGGDIAWIGISKQFEVGGYGRVVFLDGWKKIPDVALQLGYTGYVGNEQLDMGVFELDLSVGYTVHIPSVGGRATTFFSPFVGYSYLMAHARPTSVQVEAISPVSAWTAEAESGVDPRLYRFHRGFLGVEIRVNQLGFRISADTTLARKAPMLLAIDLSLGVRF
ncbi:MAG: hypothetical protein CL928_02795 [Deltaproteobacteria bacterium]|nr:hypothetical protein [Deltaproteobacteria bacterium]